MSDLVQREHGKFGGDYGWRGVLDYKSGNISETRKDRGKVTMESL